MSTQAPGHTVPQRRSQARDLCMMHTVTPQLYIVLYIVLVGKRVVGTLSLLSSPLLDVMALS